MSSEGSTAEKEKIEETEEEAQKDLIAPAEEPVAAAPPAVREVPAHLQKQVVRNIRHSKKKLLTFPGTVSSLIISSPFSQIPEEFDIDSENSEDYYMCPEYAKDIFDYLKQREVGQTKTFLANFKW